MLEIRHLRTLLALTEAGTVSRAAERVHLTQSALSHQLKALEAHYGVGDGEAPWAVRKAYGAGSAAGDIGAHGDGRSPYRRARSDEARSQAGGTLRIVLECHTCFDWLMPIMDAFRKHWPEVELDLVSGFHPNPLALLADNKTDLVIGSENKPRRGIVYHPLFRFEVLAVMPTDHRLKAKRYLAASDFAKETPHYLSRARRAHRPDPSGAETRQNPSRRRTTELTVAILQLVASRRGVAALPNWGIKNYVDYGYVIARRIGKNGLWSNLYGATTGEVARLPFVRDFLETARREWLRQARRRGAGAVRRLFSRRPASSSAPGSW